MVATGFGTWIIFYTYLAAGSLMFFLYILVEIDWVGAKWILKGLSPFRWLGVNPLVIYLSMQFVHTIFFYNIMISSGDVRVGLWIWIYHNVSPTIQLF